MVGGPATGRVKEGEVREGGEDGETGEGEREEG